MSSLGTRLADTRSAAGLTQLEASRRLGVDPTTLSRWERGKAEPALDAIRNAVAEYGFTYAPESICKWIVFGGKKPAAALRRSKLRGAA